MNTSETSLIEHRLRDRRDAAAEARRAAGLHLPPADAYRAGTTAAARRRSRLRVAWRRARGTRPHRDGLAGTAP